MNTWPLLLTKCPNIAITFGSCLCFTSHLSKDSKNWPHAYLACRKRWLFPGGATASWHFTTAGPCLLYICCVHINISSQARKAITKGSNSVHVKLKLLYYAVYISHCLHVMFYISPVREGCISVHTYTDEVLGVAALAFQSSSANPLDLPLATYRWRRAGCLALSAHPSRGYEKSCTGVWARVIDAVSSFLDNEKVVELLQAIKEKSITLDTIRHAPHPLCKSPPAHISGETFIIKHKDTFLMLMATCLLELDGRTHPQS